MQIKRPSKLYLFIAYFLALAPGTRTEKGTNICECQSAAKYAKQLWLTPTRATGQGTGGRRQRPISVDIVCGRVCLFCMRVMMTIVRLEEESIYWPQPKRWPNKVENQKKNCSTTLDDNKCCRQIQILSTTLAGCAAPFVGARVPFLPLIRIL